MRNRKELRDARRKLQEATNILACIEALPRRVGSLIQWGDGDRGVIWRRIGDDQWTPLHPSNNYEWQEEYGIFHSAHVAYTWQGWRKLDRLPPIPASSSTGEPNG